MTIPANSTTHGTDDFGLAATTVFELLSSRRRLHALYGLFGSDREITLDDLAERIARLEGKSAGKHADRIRADLHHRHLPKLVAAGVVRRGEDGIGRTAAADRLLPYLELAASEDSRYPVPTTR